MTPRLIKTINPFPRLLLSYEARETIVRETWTSASVETGGILIGRIEAPFILHIISASGPGPNAKQTPTYFLRDTNWCAEFLQQQYERSGADYLGDWHSHVRGIASDELSSGDFMTLLKNVHDPDYADLPGFAKILVVRGSGRRRSTPQNDRTQPDVNLKGFIATREFIVELPIEVAAQSNEENSELPLPKS